MNAKDAWRATLGQLQIELNRSTYDTWLRHAELLGYEDGRFVVTVPNGYAKDWIERHLLSAMTDKISRLFQRESEIQLVVWDPVEEVEEEEAPLLAFTPDHSAALKTLNPRYTFATLAVGDANRYAVLLGQAIVDSPIGKYSPVLFYGDMGMGKTHLLQAITRNLIDKGSNAIYVTAEDFATELFAAIRSHDNANLRDKYRTADAVIIDDIQFIEGKDSVQNEIVAIWDTLRNQQKTMIFAANCLPAEMGKLTKDVRSRLGAGPIAHLEAPDLALRMDILSAHSEQRRMELPLDLCESLAAHIQSSARDLESAVEQLHTYTQLTGQSIRSAAQILFKTFGTSIQPSPTQRIDLVAVLTAIASYYQISLDDLSSRRRTKTIAHARQLVMYLAREETMASLPQIGEALGGRDHSTVVHGYARITSLLQTDLTLVEDIRQIRAILHRGSPETVINKMGKIATKPGR